MRGLKIANKTPYEAELEGGRKYAWCCSGLSAMQPFCDDSHSATDLEDDDIYR